MNGGLISPNETNVCQPCYIEVAGQRLGIMRKSWQVFHDRRSF